MHCREETMDRDGMTGNGKHRKEIEKQRGCVEVKNVPKHSTYKTHMGLCITSAYTVAERGLCVLLSVLSTLLILIEYQVGV